MDPILGSEYGNKTSGTSTPSPNPNNVGHSSAQILPPLSIAAGNHDRAWNDPPVFSLEVNGTVKSVPTKLNKRVAYPGISTNPVVSFGSAPPPAPIQAGPLPPLKSIPPTKVDFIRSFSSPGSSPEEESKPTSVATHGEGNANADSTSAVLDSDIDVKHRVIAVMWDCLKKEPTLEVSVEAEVKKRLELLASKWESLPTDVRVKLSDLALAMETQDYRNAESIQLTLSSNFMSYCGQWIMALKQIIRKNFQ